MQTLNVPNNTMLLAVTAGAIGQPETSVDADLYNYIYTSKSLVNIFIFFI
jgi:hypothetical protein